MTREQPLWALASPDLRAACRRVLIDHAAIARKHPKKPWVLSELTGLVMKSIEGRHNANEVRELLAYLLDNPCPPGMVLADDGACIPLKDSP